MFFKTPKFFDKKTVCKKCKKKLSKKAFEHSSHENICISCDFGERESQKREESENNWQYIEKNCRTLFMINCDAYVSTTSVGFDISQRKPCIINNHVFGPRDSWMYWSYSHIEFSELKELANSVSKEIYEKYKNMDESNWQQYIEKIEQLNNRSLVLYTGSFQQYGFSNITLKYCPQSFCSKSWWELKWQGVLENQYGSGGSIALAEDFMEKCSALELYQHFKQRLNTSTEIPHFYDNEEVATFLKNIQS